MAARSPAATSTIPSFTGCAASASVRLPCPLASRLSNPGTPDSRATAAIAGCVFGAQTNRRGAASCRK